MVFNLSPKITEHEKVKKLGFVVKSKWCVTPKRDFVNKWLPVLVSDGVGSLRNETHMRYSVTTNITCRT